MHPTKNYHALKNQENTFFSTTGGKNQILEKGKKMIGLAYKIVKTAIITMFHTLRSIWENKHDEGGKVKDVTLNLNKSKA